MAQNEVLFSEYSAASFNNTVVMIKAGKNAVSKWTFACEPVKDNENLRWTFNKFG